MGNVHHFNVTYYFIIEAEASIAKNFIAAKIILFLYPPQTMAIKLRRYTGKLSHQVKPTIQFKSNI